MSNGVLPDIREGMMATAPAEGEEIPQGQAGAVQPETPPSPLLIPKAELKAAGPRTPEMAAEEVALSQRGYDELVRTITYHIELIEKMASASKPAAITQTGSFYEMFKKQFPSADFTDSEIIADCARQFLEKSGAELRLALKLAEWEGATLQAMSGRMAVRSLISERPIKESQTVYFMSLDGLEKQEVTTEPGFWDRLLGRVKKEGVKFRYDMVGGETMVVESGTGNNTLLTAEQENFLKAAGWTTGNLTDEQRAILDQRLYSIASARTELYMKTGLKPADIELNFIKADTSAGAYSGRNYIDRTTAYFIGETTGANIRDVIKTDADQISTEVKNKTQEELDKKKKEYQETRVEEGTVRQLEAAIEKIRQSYEDMTDAEKEIRRNEVQAEIKRLEDQLRLFGRRDALPAEIAEAQKTRDEAEAQLKDHETNIHAPAGESSVDIVAWSGTGTEGWRAIKNDCDQLELTRAGIQLEIDRFEKKAASLRSSPPPQMSWVRRVTQYDATTGMPQATVEEPHAQATSKGDAWEKTIETLEQRIEKLYEKIYKDKSQGIQTLAEAVDEKKAKYTRRKAVVEEETTVEILKAYHDAEQALAGKNDEQTKVSAQITALLSGTSEADFIRDIKSKVKAEKEELEAVGAPAGADKLEVQSLTALKPVFGSANKESRENRLRDAELGILGQEYGPQWKDYPDIIKRCAQLIWGDEVMESYPENPELAKQVMDLMRSKRYLDVIIDVLEPHFSIATGNANKSAAIDQGAYLNIADVFSSATGLNGLTVGQANKELIDKIIEEIRKKALGLS